MFHWLKPAVTFSRRHRKELAARPVWLFSSGPLGAYDPDAPPVGLGERFVQHMPAARAALPAGDFRDWPAIDAWAAQIAAELEAGQPRGE